MLNRSILVVLLALAGCSSPAPTASLAGEYVGTCSGVGVRMERGEPDAPVNWTNTESMIAIEDGAMSFAECEVPVVGFDGARFDFEPTRCELPDANLVYDFGEGGGRLGGDILTIELEVRIEYLLNGWQDQITYTCTVAR